MLVVRTLRIRLVPSLLSIVALVIGGVAIGGVAIDGGAARAEPPITSATRELHVLFLGNSFTARHDLAKTMAYLTACTFYGALCDRRPQGLSIDTLSDTKPLDAKHPDQDQDGHPLTHRSFCSTSNV